MTLQNLNYAHRLALTMTALILLAAVTIGYPLIYSQFSIMEEQFNYNGETLASQVAANSVSMVFSEDQQSLNNLVQSVATQKNVISVIIIDRDYDLTAASGPQPDMAILHNEANFYSATSFTGSDNQVWFSAPILFKEVSGGVAWIGLDKSPLIKNQTIVVSSALTLVALLVCAIIWLGIRLSQRLSKPINDLITAAKAIGSGNYSYRIDDNNAGEFADLEEAFNKMAQGLEQKLTVEKNFSRFVSGPVASHYMTRDDSEITLKGERVEASILFVDLVNYTAFSNKHTSEVVADVLNFYFSEFSDACHRFQGNVDKYIGDCAMLVFGCPAADAKHRQHALQCAIFIRDRIQLLNEGRKAAGLPWMDIRIGLAGGTVLAGLLGSAERLNYSVVGEAANLAARLCAKAPQGGILTDRAFLNLLGDKTRISTHETQRIQVKGFSEEIETLVIDELITT
ncbi:adenylate/guanylate cyclase domain-containing protein [Reinekea marinisedimentorum]|uniref:Adenylate cyclase n=1 Tax=Reinekea marinisedimentorum TaxID=230495 RepID=A0A4R3I772_9GAMM|nr:adenylate/guanylate cyclase domain-containing protein [Reinekea marinisedimentorum]TCS41590.1 adenylate cyclase [Reinekea marinisedimentorum]